MASSPTKAAPGNAASFAGLLASKGWLLADGAMGTQLFAAGLEAGAPPEVWNLQHPEVVVDIHRRWLEAGADLVLTNSFGGNRYRLALHGLAGRVAELNKAAARNARTAADAEATSARRPTLVAGSMGPTGELLEPIGRMNRADCESAFAQQAAALAEGGVDLLWIETMSDLAEVEAALAGVRSVCDLPVAATMSFDTSGRTMMGVTGSQMASRLGDQGLVAMGANCGANLGDTGAAALEIRQALEAAGHNADGLPAVIVKPNAGIPTWQGDKLVYDATPQTMAAHAHHMRAGGATVIGGCCGTVPDHIAKIAAVLAGRDPVPEAAVASRTGDLGDAGDTAGATSSRPQSASRAGRERRRRTARRGGITSTDPAGEGEPVPPAPKSG